MLVITSSVAPPWSRIWPITWWIADKWLFRLKRTTAAATDSLKEVDFPMTLSKKPCNTGHFVLSSWINGSMSISHKSLPVEFRRIDASLNLQIVFDSLTASAFIKRCISFLKASIPTIFLARVLLLSPLKMDFKTLFHCPYTILDLTTPCNLPR